MTQAIHSCLCGPNMWGSLVGPRTIDSREFQSWCIIVYRRQFLSQYPEQIALDRVAEPNNKLVHQMQMCVFAVWARASVTCTTKHTKHKKHSLKSVKSMRGGEMFPLCDPLMPVRSKYDLLQIVGATLIYMYVYTHTYIYIC